MVDGVQAKILGKSSADGVGSGPKTWLVGIPWTKNEFLAEALTVVHPFDRAIKVPSRIARAWHNMA
eukprot:1596253-Karenia_brevis.AAC.1